MSQLLTNKYLLIVLGFIAVVGLLFIGYSASQNVTSPVSKPSEQTLQPKSVTLPPPVKDHPVSGQIIVKFKPQYTQTQITEHLQLYHASIIRTIEGINQTVVQVPAGQEETIMQKLQTDGYAETAQRDYTTHAFFVPNDPGFPLQYALSNIGQSIQGKAGKAHADLNIESAWDVTQGNGIKVAILDTGINLNQPDLAGKVVLQKSFVSNTVEDGNGHGTHVAGIIAADTNNSAGVAGTCPKCQLIIGKILDDSGSGTTSNATAGITWAADQGAKVINMSLGTTEPTTNSLYAQAVSYAMSKGAVVVAAAGNDGTNQLNYPAAAANVISVAATTNIDQKASYSNFGSYVQIAAPGDNILSTGPTHSFQEQPFGYSFSTPYMYMSGTSMATPYVSGVAALVASTQFGTSPQAIINRLYATADKIAGTGSDWKNGRVNAALAVGTAPTATTVPHPTSITPTLYCVGGNGTPPCATIPAGVTITQPQTGGGNPGVSITGPASGGSISPSNAVSPTSETSISPSISPAPNGTPNSGGTNVCSVNASKLITNVIRQNTSAAAHGGKTHIKCEPGQGRQGGGTSGGYLSQFFKLLLQLLLQLLQQIIGCLQHSPTGGTPTPSVSPAQISVSPNPSVSVSASPSINSPSPFTGNGNPTTKPTVKPTVTTPPVTSSNCTNPTHTIQIDTKNPHNSISLGNYFVDTDTWNYVSGMTQTVYVCNYNNWYVVAGNMAEAGGVKSYPNVHEDFNNVAISSFKTVTSTFASVSPPQSDIYDAAYDIWINNYATEVMIWNNSWNKNSRLTPGGTKQTTVTFGGKSYDVYKNGNYIAFVATTPYDSGTLDLLQIFKWITSQGWIASNSTLTQIDYGIEFISTNNQSATFKLTNFSVTAN